MPIIINESFDNRADLDAYIKKTFGDDAEVNKSITIELPQEELSKLLLSEKVTVFGVKIKKI
jgi:hypothetical protein